MFTVLPILIKILGKPQNHKELKTFGFTSSKRSRIIKIQQEKHKRKPSYSINVLMNKKQEYGKEKSLPETGNGK